MCLRCRKIKIVFWEKICIIFLWYWFLSLRILYVIKKKRKQVAYDIKRANIDDNKDNLRQMKTKIKLFWNLFKFL